MNHYRYLIIGAGMAADAATHGIRVVDPDGLIGVVGDEPVPPYNRPPLSKMLWTGESLHQIWRKPERIGVEFHLGRRIVRLDPDQKQAFDNRGDVYSFDACLLATGGTPRRLPFGGDRIIYLRTLADYRRLRPLADVYDRFAVLGGGFIGSEIAASLAMNHKHVTMVFPGKAIGARIFPSALAHSVNTLYHDHDVEILAETTATDLISGDDELVLSLRNAHDRAERQLAVDAVIAGIGIEPNVELARAAGLEIDDGVVVDPFLRTSHPNIFAAGDIARFYCSPLEQRIRLEHEDNANSMGYQAGRSMAGQGTPFQYVPFFYSSLFDQAYRAVGELDARFETVEDWMEPYHKGIVYYLHDKRVRGVLLWNVWRLVEAARELISGSAPFQPADLKGRLVEPK